MDLHPGAMGLPHHFIASFFFYHCLFSNGQNLFEPSVHLNTGLNLPPTLALTYRPQTRGTIMMMAVAALATCSLFGAAVAVHGCDTNADCSLAGLCTSSVCVCDKGFRGSKCDCLDLSGNATTTIDNLPFTAKSTTIDTVWGGHAVQEAGASGHGQPWFWFGSALKGSLGNWATGSNAGSSAPAPTFSGPFKLSTIVEHPDGTAGWHGGSIHGVYLIQNPKPWDNKTDTWLLYFTGYAKANPLGSRVVGVAYSPTLKGPWAIWPKPVFAANPNSSAVDSSSVSNPAPAFDTFAGTGRVLLAYKGLGKKNATNPTQECTDGSGNACVFVAEASHWTGPYAHSTADTAQPIILGEDPTLWQDTRGNWHMVYEHYVSVEHGGTKHGGGSQSKSTANAANWSAAGVAVRGSCGKSGTCKCGATAFSSTGIDGWVETDPSAWYGTRLTLNGKQTVVVKRERPQVILDAVSKHPIAIFNGVCTDGTAFAHGGCFNAAMAFNH